MALPRQDRSGWQYGAGSAEPFRERVRAPKDRAGQAKVLRRQAERRRRFVALVVIPVLLMLGSIFLHTISGGLEDRIAKLDERVSEARADSQALDVRVADLSAPGRILDKATDLGMREPSGEDMIVESKNGEDVRQNAGEKLR